MPYKAPNDLCAHWSLQAHSGSSLLCSLMSLIQLQYLHSLPWLCQALSSLELFHMPFPLLRTLFFPPCPLRDDILSPLGWVRTPCYEFSPHFVFLYQTSYHNRNCGSIWSAWIPTVSLIYRTIFPLSSFLCVLVVKSVFLLILDVRVDLSRSQRKCTSFPLLSLHCMQTRQIFLRTKSILLLRQRNHVFCWKWFRSRSNRDSTLSLWAKPIGRDTGVLS